MKTLVSTLLISGVLATLALPGSAEIRVKDVHVKKDSGNAAVKVTVRDNKDKWMGPYTTYIFVRPNDKSSWALARQYRDTTALGVDSEKTFEITAADNDTLRQVSNNPDWEARAVIRNGDAERVSDKAEPYHYSDSADR